MINRIRTLLNQPALAAEFIRYLMVGGLAFSADFGALALLTSGFGVNYLFATLLAFLLGTLVNYQLSIRWVFNYRSLHQQSVEFVIFLLVGVITLGLSLGLMALLAGQFGLYYLLAKCVATGFTLIVNFGLRRALLFSHWPSRISALLVTNRQLQR